MTRYARAKGSKASNEKLPEDSTPWEEIQKQILRHKNSIQAGDTNKTDGNTKSPASSVQEITEWAEISDVKSNLDPTSEDENDFSDFMTNDGTISTSRNNSILLLNTPESSKISVESRSSNSCNSFLAEANSRTNSKTYESFKTIKKEKNSDKFQKQNGIKILSRGNDLSYTLLLNGEATKIVNFEGFYIKEVDAERLQQLRKKLYQEKKIPDAEIVRTIQLERRKAEKAFQREMKNVCYNCRQSGHFVSECPEYSKLNNESAVGSGICYKCGSTEHTSYNCRMKTAKFRFAQCFICNEQGHISRECPDNPRGIYPKGGACKGCGDVTHFVKDCPVLIKKKESKPFTLGTLNNNNVEALDDNFNFATLAPRKNINKRKHSGMKSFYRQKRFRK